jgi:hypothetical protein
MVANQCRQRADWPRAFDSFNCLNHVDNLSSIAPDESACFLDVGRESFAVVHGNLSNQICSHGFTLAP